jgi:Cu+-exporting ATPase
MSCAGCVASVEKALRGVSGVCDVKVNLASERATVEYLAGMDGRDFERAVERAVEDAGYGVVREEDGSVEDIRALEYGRLRRRFFVAAALTALVVAGSLPMMVGSGPGRWFYFVLLALATPVQASGFGSRTCKRYPGLTGGFL